MKPYIWPTKDVSRQAPGNQLCFSRVENSRTRTIVPPITVVDPAGGLPYDEVTRPDFGIAPVGTAFGTRTQLAQIRNQ